MIPRTFPSTFASNGQQRMVVYSLPSIAGLTAWIDYIPVKGVTTESAALENTYANNGYQVVDSLTSLTGKQAWLDYIPVYEDPSYTKPWSTDAGGYIPTSALAALLLDFTSGLLDPRITFSRTTNATLTNSAGLVANAPMNLLTFSEQFDNAAWTKTNTTVTANTGSAPDGTTTADLVVPNTSNAFHELSRSFSSSGSATLSAFVKASGYSHGYLNFGGLSNGTVGFNLATPGVFSQGAGITAASVTDVGNGWYRVVATVNGAFTTFQIGVLSSASIASFAGNGTSGLLVSGAQLEASSTATTYNPTTVKNLLGFTENFDNTAWAKSNATISATKVDDIYGQPFAQKLVENTVNNFHGVNVLSTLIAGTTYTQSVYAKAAERSWMAMTEGNNVTASAWFNLSNGTVGTVNGTGSPSASITDVGNGWYRCSLRFTPIAAAGNTQARVATGDGVSSYTGDGTSGIFIFGAQLSDSASVDPYVYQPVAAPASTAYFGPRFDYDPVTLAPKGLLIEEQRTQLLLNSSLAGTSLATQNVTVAAVAHTLTFYGTGTVTLSGVSTAGPLVGTGAYPNRATLTFTPTAGTLTLTVTGTVQFAQLEAGAFATSFIPSAASQVTRAADSASMIGNNFARWYNVNEGTLYGQSLVGYTVPAASFPLLASVSDGTNNNRMLFGYLSASSASFEVSVGGVAQVGLFPSVTSASRKLAATYKVNDFAVAVNGGAVSTDTSGAVPIVTQLNIGANPFNGLLLNGTIPRIAYYNRRLSNTELQGITS